MTPSVSTGRSNQAECFATAPQGNVTQAGHKYATKQSPPSPNVTNTLKSGEAEQLRQVDALWRAANYLSAGQIYLMDNALLREELRPEHIKPRLLGHWGTTPGLNLIYAHLNRAIRDHDLDMMFVTGPGHGGPALLANTWLEGTYTDAYPDITRDADGMRALFRQFSFPGGVPSHVAPSVPGSIHEGGELGYSLAHAFGAALDNPELIVACVVGDGEAETGPLATSWHLNKFLDAAGDGTVLPILHLNGYKIANPTILSRIPAGDLNAFLSGLGYKPHYIIGSANDADPASVHRQFAAALDQVVAEIRRIRWQARTTGRDGLVRWPLIVLRTPKGWTGPSQVDGVPVEGTWRAHQVPLTGVRDDPARLASWLRSYRPDELFDADGTPRPDVLAPLPPANRRMGASRHANGGVLRRTLRLPNLVGHQEAVPEPGGSGAEPTRMLGAWLRDLISNNPSNFRIFGPDETASNRLTAVYEVTGNQWQEQILPTDEHLVRSGRVIEVLSEHLCQGALEGYLLSGRHGLLNTYEAFAHIVDSMVNQHAKWLTESRRIPWRRPVASLNYLLTSHVWRQDHNGFSHQDPGFIDHVLTTNGEVTRVYLPPDTNTLLAVAAECFASSDRINVIVAGKTATPNWLDPEQAGLHCARGAGVWEWAGNTTDIEPDVVLACAGDAPTVETLAAAALLRRHLPELGVRVVNVVDLVRLQPDSLHPHGMPDTDFTDLFTMDKPVIFAYHGYPWLIHRLTYRRANHHNLHVRGYKEQGTTTTPFDMLVRNDMDRFQLVIDVLDRVPDLGVRTEALRERMRDQRRRHHTWIREHGEDLPEIREWHWPHT